MGKGKLIQEREVVCRKLETAANAQPLTFDTNTGWHLRRVNGSATVFRRTFHSSTQACSFDLLSDFIRSLM